jgi:hypothetical protein
MIGGRIDLQAVVFLSIGSIIDHRGKTTVSSGAKLIQELKIVYSVRAFMAMLSVGDGPKVVV